MQVASLARQQSLGGWRAGSSSVRPSRSSRLVVSARQFRTIREDIDKKRLEKKLGTQESEQPKSQPAAREAAQEGPSLAVGAAVGFLAALAGVWFLTHQ